MKKILAMRNVPREEIGIREENPSRMRSVRETVPPAVGRRDDVEPRRLVAGSSRRRHLNGNQPIEKDTAHAIVSGASRDWVAPRCFDKEIGSAVSSERRALLAELQALDGHVSIRMARESSGGLVADASGDGEAAQIGVEFSAVKDSSLAKLSEGEVGEFRSVAVPKTQDPRTLH